MLNRKEKLQKSVLYFCILCCLVYFSSYLARKSFNASLVSIVASGIMTRQMASLPIMITFISYGIGQVICGIIGDKISPRYMITFGLIGSAICNILLPIFPSLLVISILWGINGFLQAMIWPPLVRAMSEIFPSSFYNKGSQWVLVSATIATVCSYLIASVWAKVEIWQGTMFVAAFFAIVVGICWFLFGYKESKVTVISAEKVDKENNHSFSRLIIVSGVLPLLICPIGCGLIRDGSETWTSSMLLDIFSLDVAGSLLSVAIIPALGTLGILFASWLNKKIPNVVGALAVTWAINAVLVGLLVLTLGKSIVINIILLALISGITHSSNMLLTSRIPVFFKKYKCVSTISGLVNSFTYVGSAIATYGVAGLAESKQWNVMILLFLGATLVAMSMSVILIRRWNKFTKAN